MPYPLRLKEISDRLARFGYKQTEVVDGLISFSKTIEIHFPYSRARSVSYPVPGYPEDMNIPSEITEDILLHLHLTTDEEEEFWGESAAKLQLVE